MENKAAVNPLREHRLYQASFLLRDYGFDLEEMPFVQDGNLPLTTDPKLAWAEQNLRGRPLEINKAERRELLRLPGIGPKGADAILRARRIGKVRDLASLKKLGVVTTRIAPFILLDGRPADQQLAFFS
jgi:predicted DNA-binding helix-hairpin-helix protein